MFQQLFRNIVIASMFFVASGCLLTTSNSVKESGVEIGESTLAQIEVGKTTEPWLLATLGEPSSRAKVAGEQDVAIFGYNHQVVKASKGKLFLLFSGKSEKVEKADTYFEITDGVVTKYWRE